ncbi:MAG: glycosyltransferase family 4 protein [Bacteroidales bacterium]|nr:glycosyltransferase family 4 protein [Bacteroidales bacterium]
MKIFLVIPTLKQGGAERVMSELTNEFAKQKHEVHLILLASVSDFYSIDDSVTIHRLAFVNRGRLHKLFDEMKVFFKLRNLLSLHRPDATLSFMDKYNILTILASRFLNLNVFVSDRSNPFKKIPLLISFLKIHTYKYANGIIAQTQLAKKILEKKTKNKNIKVIPNPIKNIEHFPEVSRENIILSVGRLVPEKGHKYLIDAFSNLDIEDWKLVILGEGVLRTDLEKQINGLSIQDKVILYGAVQDVDKWLSKVSVFAFPSISEGFPNALVEAMSVGLPCVSFDCKTGPKDIIENHKNGILVEEKNIEELTIALKILISDEQLRRRLGNEAIKIKKHLSLEKISKEYFEFISDN